MSSRRIGRAAAVVLITVAAFLVGTAAPAFAHEAEVGGSAVCEGGEWVVTWTITNGTPDLTMDFDSVTAQIGAQTFAVTGYTAPVPGGGSTTATTLIPGTMTGIASLEVEAHWEDGYQSSSIAEVTLDGTCVDENTTTTTGETTTTTPPTTESTTTTSVETVTTEGSTPTTIIDTDTTISTETTFLNETTSTVGSEGSTIPVTASGNTSTPSTAAPSSSTGSLPFTGGGGGASFGIASLLLGGLALVLSTRRKRRS